MSDQVKNFDGKVGNISDQVEGMSDQVAKTTKTAQRRADQDQIISNFIGDLEANLDALDNDTEISSRMAPRGFGEPKRAEGRGFLLTLKTSYQTRQVALGTQGEKASTNESAEKGIRTGYSDFRATVRTALPDVNARKALGVSGIVPTDTQKFLTLAETSYHAATQEPYQAALAAFGLGIGELRHLLAGLETFKAGREAHQEAIAAAKNATRTRDDAYQIALKWNRDLLRMAKIALRDRPDLLARLR